MSMSTYAANLVLSTFYGADAADAAPTMLYLAFFNGDPAGAGTELTGTGGVSRILITNDGSNFATPDDGSVSNAAVWQGAAAASDWASDADHWAFFDAPTGGNLIESGLVVDGSGDPTTLTVTMGTVITVPIGTWVLTQPTS